MSCDKMKKLMIMAVCLIFIFSSLNSVSSSCLINSFNNKNEISKIDGIINKINGQDLNYYLEKITVEYSGRKTGTETCEKTAEYLYSELNKIGGNLIIEYQEFEGLGKDFTNKPFPHWKYYTFKLKNVIAKLPGSKPNSKTVIFSAHYDVSNINSPGALDNGAGIAALLTIAKAMSNYTFENNIKFICFPGEEFFFMGSYAYAKKAYNHDEKILGVINADVIGNNTYNNANKNLIRAYGNDQSQWIINIMSEIGEQSLNLEVKKQPTYHGNSDDKAFDDYGYGAMQIFQSAFSMEDFYGNSLDTIDLININYLTRVAKLIGGSLAMLGSKKTSTVEIISPKEDTRYCRLESKEVNYPTIDRHTAGDTIVGEKNILIKVKASENINKVKFEILCGDNEKGNKIRDSDKNDEEYKKVIRTEEISEKTGEYFEWNLKNQYLNWYTVRVTGYDDLENTYIDHVEIKFLSIEESTRTKIIFNLFNFILEFINDFYMKNNCNNLYFMNSRLVQKVS